MKHPWKCTSTNTCTVSLFTGKRDLLLSDVIRFHQKLKTSDGTYRVIRVRRFVAWFCGYQNVKEGDQAYRKVVAFEFVFKISR